MATGPEVGGDSSMQSRPDQAPRNPGRGLLA